jgi:hypothetical protein
MILGKLHNKTTWFISHFTDRQINAGCVNLVPSSKINRNVMLFLLVFIILVAILVLALGIENPYLVLAARTITVDKT